MVGNFNECKDKQFWIDGYSGFRDCSIPNALADGLEEYYDVERLDISHIPQQECGMSRIVGNDYERGHIFFIIQNQIAMRIDIPDPKIIYFHIDDVPSINSKDVKYVIKIWIAAGKFDYKLTPGRQYDILPFINPSHFNPNREKDLMVSDISRDLPYGEYKDILERSCYVLVHAHHWLSKRVFQAAACRTIPIIVTRFKKDCYEYRGITDNIALFRTPGNISSLPKEYDGDMADRTYNWVLDGHTIDHRMGRITEIVEKVRALPL